MATNDSPLNVAASRGLSLALGQANTGPLTDAQWAARLSRSGSGTPDATFDPETDIAYLGAFRIPYYTGGESTTRDKLACAFNPPEVGGRNGSNGSLFIGGSGAGGGSVAEVQIPLSFSMETDHTLLPSSPFLQDFVNVYAKAPNQGSNLSNTPAGMIVSNGKLYMAMYAFYDADASNTENLLICNDCANLASASYQGMLNRTGEDLGSKYALEVPSEHQAAIGGTHLSGAWASHSIIGRSSLGPAFVAWNPASIQPVDTAVSAAVLTNYQTGTEVQWFDYEHSAVAAHYEAAIGTSDLQAFLNSDPTTRIDSFDSLPLPEASLYGLGGSHESNIQCAFIPPGSSTVVLIGNDKGTRYGLGYKGKYIEYGNTLQDTPGFYPYSAKDVTHRFWTMNINDIANAATLSEPGFIKTGVFDGDRWLDVSESKPKGAIASGCFDPDSGRLYVLHANLRWNDFETQKVVSVYQIGAV